MAPGIAFNDGEKSAKGRARTTDGESLTDDEIRACLEQTRGSLTWAAQLLGMSSRHALYRLMKKRGIKNPYPTG